MHDVNIDDASTCTQKKTSVVDCIFFFFFFFFVMRGYINITLYEGIDSEAVISADI